MADLDADDREKIPTKEFGLPEKARTKEAKKESGNYPMPDKAHARNAKSRAAQAQKAGDLSQEGSGADRPQGGQDPRQVGPAAKVPRKCPARDSRVAHFLRYPA